MAFIKAYFEVAFETLVQMDSSQSVLAFISQNTFLLPCHSMHHIVHCIDRVSSLFVGVVPPW